MINTIKNTVKNLFKNYWHTLVFFGLSGILGGFFVGLYLMDGYPEAIRNEIYAQGLNDMLIAVISAMQAAVYGILLGAIGIFLGEKTRLFKNERHIEQKPLLAAGAVALVGGLAMILFDLLWFGRVSEAIMDSYAAKPTVPYIIGSVIYGGVIEEVMLRLFMMTLIAFILLKLCAKRDDKCKHLIFTVANIISSLLFAAGHLPATALLLGITPVILFRCFLLNGGIGFLFGWLYQRYGLRYAMIAHAGAHIVSKIIWIIFI